jgi:hypothetical protein
MKVYNISDVISQLMYHRTAEQTDMVRDISREMQNNRAVTNFMAELTERAIQNQKRPIDTLGLSLMYGIVIGLCVQAKEKVH